MTENNINPSEAQAVTPQVPEMSPAAQPSYFHGTTLQLIGWRLLGILLSILTLGIGAPWAHCMVYRWQINHTTVEGQKLYFNGKGHQLLGKYLLWGLLILVTFGIYTIFLPVRVRKWFLKHTAFATGKEADGASGVGIIVAFISVMLTVVMASVLILTQMQTEKAPQSIYTPGFQQSTNATSSATPDTTEDTSTESSLWYVNISVGLRLRTEPNTDAEVLEIMAHGTPVYVEYWEGDWAFIGTGWCHGKYLTRENPLANNGSQNGNQGSNQTGTISSSIIGTWHEVDQCEHPYDTNGIAYRVYATYVFGSDGTFAYYPKYATYEYDPGTGTSTFLTEQEFVNISEGTFTYDGSVLTITVTVDHGHPDRPVPYTYSYESATVSGNTMYVTIDGCDDVLEKGTLDQVMARLYSQTNSSATTPTSPPATTIPTITGAPWTHARYDATTGRLHMGNSYMFNTDGTFSGTYTDSSYIYDRGAWVWDYSMGTGGQSFEGTYTFDGSTLTLTYTYMEWEDTVPAPRTYSAYVESSVLYVDGTPYYTGNLETISKILCPNPPASSSSPLDPAIVGTWSDAWYESDAGKLMENGYYSFASDGTFSGAYHDRSYIYSTADGWIYDYASNSGSQRFSGTYQYDGSTLLLNFDYMEWDSIPEPKFLSAYISNGVLYINSRPHYQGSTNDIGNRLCPNPTGSGTLILDSSIFGTWYEFLRNVEGDQLYYPVAYTFNSDGTYSRSTQDSYFSYTEEFGVTNVGSGSDTTYGTYSYSNGVLTLDGEQISVTIANDILYLRDDVLYRTDDPWSYALANLPPQ